MPKRFTKASANYRGKTDMTNVKAIALDPDITTENGKVIPPVMVADVELRPSRRAMGFHKCATILIYPNTNPCSRLIFVWKEKFMELQIEVDTADDVLTTMRLAQTCLCSVVEGILVGVFDSMPEAHRVMLELDTETANVN